MITATFNEGTKRYEADISGATCWLWIGGYCGRLFVRPNESGHLVEMNDGTLVDDLAMTLDELRWMVGNYRRSRRFGKRPSDSTMIELARQNDARPNLRTTMYREYWPVKQEAAQ